MLISIFLVISQRKIIGATLSNRLLTTSFSNIMYYHTKQIQSNKKKYTSKCLGRISKVQTLYQMMSHHIHNVITFGISS